MAVGVLELSSYCEMALCVSDISESENFRNARAGLSRFCAVRAGMLYDVRHRRMARRLAQTSEMIQGANVRVLILVMAAITAAVPVRAGNITLSPDAARALDETYSGDPDAAILTA